MGADIKTLNQNVVKMVDTMKSGFSKLGTTVSSVMTEEMGAATEAFKSGFSFLKDTGSGTLRFLTKSFALDLHSHKIQKDQLKIQKAAFRLEKKNRLASLRQVKGKGGAGWLAWLLGIPLYLLTKKFGFTGIAKFFKRWIPFAKWFDEFKFPKMPQFTFFKRFGIFLKGIPKLPGLKMLRGFGTKLGIVGMFLTSLFGILDFMEGWKKSKGTTFWQKYKDGLSNSVNKFLDDTIGFVAWGLDKLLGLVGIEIDLEGKAKWLNKKITGFYTSFLEFIVNPAGSRLDILSAALGITEKGEIDKKITALKEKIASFPELLWEWIKTLPGVEFIKEQIKRFQEGALPSKYKEAFEKGKEDGFSGLTSHIKDMISGNKKKVEDTPRKALLKELKINNEYQKTLVERSKEGGEIITVPIPVQQPITRIPAGTDDRLIENMTARELGLENGY